MRKILFLSIVFVLLTVIGYSSYQLLEIHRNTTQEAEVHRWLMQYHPLSRPSGSAEIAAETSMTETPGGTPAETSGETPAETADLSPTPKIVNQSIVDLQTGHPDVVGWLMIENTRIDYPFAQGIDNDYYLHLDLNERWSAAGTIFMDFRNSRDFSDFHTILYGHHMQNGSMFGTLQQFSNPSFFDDNRTGTIFLAHATYEIEIIAFAVIPPNDAVIYHSLLQADEDRVAFLDHVRSVARHYREVGATAQDRIITLSTCNYEFQNARMVLIGRLVERCG